MLHDLNVFDCILPCFIWSLISLGGILFGHDQSQTHYCRSNSNYWSRCKSSFFVVVENPVVEGKNINKWDAAEKQEPCNSALQSVIHLTPLFVPMKCDPNEKRMTRHSEQMTVKQQNQDIPVRGTSVLSSTADWWVRTRRSGVKIAVFTNTSRRMSQLGVRGPKQAETTCQWFRGSHVIICSPTSLLWFESLGLPRKALYVLLCTVYNLETHFSLGVHFDTHH